MSREMDMETCRQQVDERARAAQAGERLRLWVNAIPLVGAPVAAVLAWLHPLLGSVAVAALTLGWLIAVYRTELLCHSTAGRLQDAEQELSRAQTAIGERTFEREAGVPWSRAAARSRGALHGAHKPAHH